MANITRKICRLNDDFIIECSTIRASTGKEVYSVVVKQISVPTTPIAEQFGNIASRDKANTIFLSMKRRYANPLNRGYFEE